MGRKDEYNNMSGDDLKKDFENVFKRSRRAIRDFFRGGNSRKRFGGWGNGIPPFFSNKNPLLCLLYPKLIVGGIILLTLLLCGVSLYGLIILMLLVIIFILI
ncbi:hypothetical protein [Clostridium sp.]|uniref:hypothetical protein n=1 Tax=Clostridium sp. TaxID=1506 RepID=UPI00284F43D2|nr:hypothetical protein [Clostridium sp.]MDR3597004.1 hypothetical protein [Clostridium sp.]